MLSPLVSKKDIIIITIITTFALLSSKSCTLISAEFEVNSKKTVQFSEDVEVQSIETEPEIVEIDEGKIDKVLHVLHEADPTGEVEDPADLCGLEGLAYFFSFHPQTILSPSREEVE